MTSLNETFSPITHEVFILVAPIHPFPSHPLFFASLYLSPPWSTFVLARVEHFAVSPKSLSKQEKCEYSRFSSTVPTHECLPVNSFFPQTNYKCAKGVEWKTITGHILNTFCIHFNKGNSKPFYQKLYINKNLAFVLDGSHLMEIKSKTDNSSVVEANTTHKFCHHCKSRILAASYTNTL